MERGPMTFTSDVSLPKDDKSASEVNKSQLGDIEWSTLLVGYPKWKVRCNATTSFP